ncbi:MAG TPA: arginase family protein [Jiangellaceae bacterium]|nr:arginase family protein [Jiangellaceae bacterium]
MDRQWRVLGVPSSAGAHTPGLEKGPAALREAGLVDLLRQAGCAVEDYGDIEGFRWRPDPDHPHAQNASVVARVARDVAAAVAEITRRSRLPLIVGGDCTVTVGVVAGLAGSGLSPALLYVDGGPDLYTPETRAVGNLDAMGLAHMLAIPGHVPELAGIGPAVPLLTPDEVVTYGDSLPEDDHERRLLGDLDIARISALEVHEDVRASADRALARVEAVGPAFVLHLDVDVLAFIDAPLADVPDSGDEPIGLSLDEIVTSLATFAASPRFAALVLTEVNPDHVPDAAVLRHFVERLTATLARA